jgi:bacterioferritin (cytochrome b1)
MHEVIDSTIGHMRLISRAIETDDLDPAAAKIGKRISGFTRLVDIHMNRASRLAGMLDRLQDIRTGKVREAIKAERKKIDVSEFIEDFIEVLPETPLLDPETEKHDIGDILRESLEHEKMALKSYYELLKIAEGKSVLLEEYAREMIMLEELHLDEVNKMLRNPGSLRPFKE